jgi:uncharacterized phage-associated protein
MDINKICDYIITMATEGGESLNLLKLQKLLYYTQAWHLAFYDKRAFKGNFQAWIHGPVNREIYERFADSKTLYSEVTESDIQPNFDFRGISKDLRSHIDNVLEVYLKYTGSQLEEISHNEPPWQHARKGYRPSQRCEVVIDEEDMKDYYRSLLPKQS